MMLSVAVVLGFQEAIRDKVEGFEAAISLKPLGKYYQGEADVVSFLPAMRDAIKEAVPDGDVSLVISQPVVLKTPDNFAGVVLNGYGQGHDPSFEQGNLIAGRMPEKPTDIVVSSITASKLSVSVGDKVDGCFFVEDAMKLRRLTVAGIYSSNFSDYDRLTAYGDFGMLAKLRRLGEGEADMVEIRGLHSEKIADASRQLRETLSRRYATGELTAGVNVVTLYDSGAMYFNWLALLDANVVVILVIMSLVSGFTLISCVFILILQRVGMIGVLKSFGATDGQVRRVFLLLGGRVVGLGLLIGNIAGLTFLILQSQYHLIPLDPEAYFLDYVPVRLDWGAFLGLNLGAVGIAGLLMLLPASMVSRISPARTMRYE